MRRRPKSGPMRFRTVQSARARGVGPSTSGALIHQGDGFQPPSKQQGRKPQPATCPLIFVSHHKGALQYSDPDFRRRHLGHEDRVAHAQRQPRRVTVRKFKSPSDGGADRAQIRGLRRRHGAHHHNRLWPGLRWLAVRRHGRCRVGVFLGRGGKSDIIA
jgi:hypothetical protein